MLLANVSATEKGAKRMMQVEEEEEKKKEEEAAAEGGGGKEGEDPSSSSSTTNHLPQAQKKNLLVGLHVRRLLRWFLSQYDAAAEEDEWQHVASVLHNVSQLQEGRDLLRKRTTNLIASLLPQLDSCNPIRRRGVACAVRNCCFEEGRKKPH